jgi:hypothetical protein
MIDSEGEGPLASACGANSSSIARRATVFFDPNSDLQRRFEVDRDPATWLRAFTPALRLPRS